MLRAGLLSIVLTFAAGPNVALFCSVWCHPGEEIAGACERHTPTPAPHVVASDDCTDNAGPVVFVGEDARRTAAAPDAERAVAVARFAFAPPAAGTLSAYEPNGRLLLDPRPLVPALRI